MAVYTYTRVSTAQQAEEGESLGAQQRRTEGYAMQLDLTIDRHFVERGVSGSVPLTDRPEGKALVDLLHPGDVVITPKLDRMFRALAVLDQLKAALHLSHLLTAVLAPVAGRARDGG
jgi:putative DNA-invertase from lambdoid prophage Rac